MRNPAERTGQLTLARTALITASTRNHVKHRSSTLPLCTAEAATATIPRCGIRLVRESQIIYTKNITGAEMVVDLCRTIGLQERASEELHVFYLNTKNDVIGMELVSKGTLNASLVHPRNSGMEFLL